jgi:TetR/AcrR family transcriptional regulator, regulator of cefoperazone and chloramphenicol sensitivity
MFELESALSVEGDHMVTEAKIIDSAIECIEKYGLQATTTRRIAETAGVNAAAINYYFRSKAALLNKVTQVTLANAFDPNAIANAQGDGFREKCASIFDDLLVGGCRYPGITRYHFGEILEGKTTSLPYQKFTEFMTRLAEFARSNGVDKPESELYQGLAQSVAAVMMMALVPAFFHDSLGLDLRDGQSRKAFIRSLVDRLL